MTGIFALASSLASTTFGPLLVDAASPIRRSMQCNASPWNRNNKREFPRALALAFFYVLLAIAARSSDNASIHPEYFETLRSGDAHQLLEILDRGSDPNARDSRGNTALMLAAIYGGLDSMQLLLERGAEINATNAAGATALMRAAFDPAKLSLLLEKGADVNVRSGLGNTALMLAARPPRSLTAVRSLLSRGADARITNHFGGTALMAAVAGGDTETVELLLNNHSDPNAQPTPDENGFLFGGGRSPLMWAAFRGDTASMKMLLSAGADVHAPTGLGTPLGQAAWADQIETARLLLEHGAKPDLAGPKDGY